MTARPPPLRLGVVVFGLVTLLATEARADEPHLLDTSLQLRLPGSVPGAGLLGLGLRRPSATDEQGFVGCLFSSVIPGLGQMVLGRPVLGGAILALEGLLVIVAIALLDPSRGVSLAIPAFFHFGQAFHAFVLGQHLGGGGDAPSRSPFLEARPTDPR